MFRRTSSMSSVSSTSGSSMMKSFPAFRIGSAPIPTPTPSFEGDETEENNNNNATSTSSVVPLQIKDPVRYTDVVAFARMSLPQSLGHELFDENTSEKIQVKMLTGGTSNQLYHVYCSPSINTDSISSSEQQQQRKEQQDQQQNKTQHQKSHHHPFECVIRVFGDAISQLIDREAEVFWQSKYLKTFGKCANGIAFEFLRNYKPLPEISNKEKNRVQDHMEEITRQLAALHTIHLSHPKKREEILDFLERQDENNAPEETEKRKLLAEAMLTDWLDLADHYLESVLFKNEKYASNTFLREVVQTGRLRKEANELLRTIQDNIHHHVCVPFTHNDANPLNLMVREKSDGERFEMKMIDFEYAGQNYVQFEIGTHFNEWSGLECDYSKFPNEEEQIEFLQLYFKALKASVAKCRETNGGRCLECGDGTNNNNSDESNTSNVNKKSDQQTQDDDIGNNKKKAPTCFCHLVRSDQNNNNNNKNVFETFRQMCLLHAQVAHVGWTAWSIFQAASSEIEGFDYVEYAEMRWKEYLRNKKLDN